MEKKNPAQNIFKGKDLHYCKNNKKKRVNINWTQTFDFHFTLNHEKTEVMVIGSRSRLAAVDNSPVLKLVNRHITCVYHKNFLTWFLMSSWNKHSEVECNKISQTYVNKNVQCLYFALLLRSAIWNDGSCTVINKRSNIQLRK